jgi:hypothetical protein
MFREALKANDPHYAGWLLRTFDSSRYVVDRPPLMLGIMGNDLLQHVPNQDPSTLKRLEKLPEVPRW